MNQLIPLLLITLSTFAKNFQAAIIVPLPRVISHEKDQIVLDNDFESGSVEPWYDNSPSTAHWLVEDFENQADVANPAPIPVDGKKYLRAIRDVQLSSGLLILRTPTFTALPGDQFSFQFWIRSRFIEGNNLDLVLVQNNNETLLIGLTKYSTSVNFEWRPASVKIPVTEPTNVTLVFYAYCGSNPQDAIALDNFIIESPNQTSTSTSSTTITTPSTTSITTTSSTITTTPSTTSVTTTSSTITTTPSTTSTDTTTPSTTTVTPPACGGSFGGISGTISSPNYPNLYGYDENCRYNILVSNNGRVKLDFIDFNTEGGSDFVTVYDGPNTSSPVLLRASGYTSSSLVTTGPECLVVHTSDSKNSLSGWSARYTAI